MSDDSRMRRAAIQLTEQDIEGLLDLPDGYRVLHIGADWLRSSVIVLVHSDDLDPVCSGCEPPLLAGIFSKKQTVVDGQMYYRWAWQPLAVGATP